MGRYKTIDENGIYFTTHTIIEWLPVFVEQRYFQIIVDSLKYCQQDKGLHVFGYVIMLNHFHLIAQTDIGFRFQDVMRDMKKYTSKAISNELEKDNQKLLLYVFKKTAESETGDRKYKIWQDEYHPQILYTEKVCRQKLLYMHYNPGRKGFVASPEDWQYSSARNYILDDHSMMNIEKLEMF